mmetsp:Transcript_6597/g.23282  ORF Transcript_6597/g.23282 Transcript_6597/m.23282 type:complete len:241 (-) Transcript_6597:463-1185(-)
MLAVLPTAHISSSLASRKHMFTSAWAGWQMPLKLSTVSPVPETVTVYAPAVVMTNEQSYVPFVTSRATPSTSGPFGSEKTWIWSCAPPTGSFSPLELYPSMTNFAGAPAMHDSSAPPYTLHEGRWIISRLRMRWLRNVCFTFSFTSWCTVIASTSSTASSCGICIRTSPACGRFASLLAAVEMSIFASSAAASLGVMFSILVGGGFCPGLRAALRSSLSFTCRIFTGPGPSWRNPPLSST